MTTAGTTLPTRTRLRRRRRERIFANRAARATHRHIGVDYLWQQARTGFPLLVSDCLALAVAFTAAFLVCSALGYSFTLPMVRLYGCAITALLLINICFRLYPGYGIHPVVELRQTITSVSATMLMFAVAFRARNLGGFTKWMVFYSVAWASAALAIPLLRLATRHLLARTSWWAQPVLVIGNGKHVGEIWDELAGARHLGLRPIGLLAADDVTADSQWRYDGFCGSLRDLDSIAKTHRVYHAVVALDDFTTAQRQSVVDSCAPVVPHIVLASRSLGLPSLLTTTQCLAGSTGVVAKERLLLPLPRLLKRIMDLALMLATAVVLVPTLVVIGLLVKLSSPGPIFYKQQRIGTAGQTFWAWKFRTMVVDADQMLSNYLEKFPQLRKEWEQDHKLKRDPRITPVGEFLRKTSLDELPQLWNVLVGEMSLVGPRPIVSAEIPKYDETFGKYMRVRPGITGLWQISGRNNTTYTERVRLDSYYVRNWSLWLDAYILLRTVKTVILREGAY